MIAINIKYKQVKAKTFDTQKKFYKRVYFGIEKLYMHIVKVVYLAF